jgi:hypothetical protein
MNAATVATDGNWLRISFSGEGASQKAAARPGLSAIGWNRDEKLPCKPALVATSGENGSPRQPPSEVGGRYPTNSKA